MIYNESGKVVDILQDIIDFNKKMNKDFKYGLAINGVIDRKRNISGEDYDKLYKVVDSKQFEKQQGGICWDYVIYEADYFRKNFSSIKIKAWYIIWDKQPDYPTHTFITFKSKNKYILFESSFKAIQGVYEANSEKDIINFVAKSMNDYPRKKKLLEENKFHVFTYNPLDSKLPGMNCSEFMHYIEDKGKYVNHKYNSNFKVNKLN